MGVNGGCPIGEIAATSAGAGIVNNVGNGV